MKEGYIMCLILFAYNIHPKYRLIIAANRDEYYHRPTSSAHFWEDHPYILAGRDLLKKGTWMGVTRLGRFAAITNYRNPTENIDGKYSRGDLVADFLKEPYDPMKYLDSVKKECELYPGFNLLVGDISELYYYSNIEDKITKVEPGIYGLSNHLLNTDWPKVKFGKKELTKIIENEKDLVEKLFELLQNTASAPDQLLPNTGVSLQLERMLAPLFIKSETYGTRSSTIILMTDEEIDFNERSYSKNGIENKHYKIYT